MLKQAGPYRLKRELRADVLTVAYEGESPDGELFTVLVCKSPVQMAPEDLELFRVEVEASREVAQGGAARTEPVFEHGVHHGLPWVAHRHLEGGSLAEKLDSLKGGLPGSATALVGLDLASALEAAHASDPPLLHRGLGLHNAVLDPALQVRLVGFGLAGVALDGARKTPALVRMVKRHTAPEVGTGAPLTPGVDLFALGVTLFTLLRGKPHPGGAVKLAGISLDSLLPEVPDELVALLTRLLDPTPEERGTAADAVSALRRMVDDPDAERAQLGRLLGIAPSTETGEAATGSHPEPTKETHLTDVLASLAPSRGASDTIPPARPMPATTALPARPRAATPNPASATSDDDEFGESATIVNPQPAARPEAHEPTVVTSSPEGYFEEATVVQTGGGTAVLPNPQIAPPPTAMPDPSARTKQLDLSEIPDRGDSGEAPVPPPQLDAEVLSPVSKLQQKLQEASEIEVAGWPLPWLLGVGTVAVVMLFISMVLGVWLAS